MIGWFAVLFFGLLKLVLGFFIDWMCVGVMMVVMMMVFGIVFGVYDVVIVGGVEYMGYYFMGEGVDFNLCIVVEKFVDFFVFVMGLIVENLYDCYFEIIKEWFDWFFVGS